MLEKTNLDQFLPMVKYLKTLEITMNLMKKKIHEKKTIRTIQVKVFFH